MNWGKWITHYQALGINTDRICRDGIFDELEWGKVKKKILFVMKEVNDPKNEWKNGNLKDLLRDGPKYQMWHTVARWAAGMLYDFPEYEEIDTWDKMKKVIRKIASINLKKTSGGSFSNMSVINAYAYIDKELLLEQINEIQPHIIVACGTFDSLIWLLGLEINPDNPYEKPIFNKKRNIRVIQWRHPARVNNKKTYNELKGIFAKIGNT